ncbi:MAG: tetratricopeptide repeat protein [Armatimonadetes bacterium]|jgi:tetratricopeptide (TPR) repeat protein|nr:tetratricopeptide repeat protein [Armatimonadota bacterium]MDI9602893.1 tetratricopeptide repeat protein [Acidobacteriota bacterium]
MDETIRYLLDRGEDGDDEEAIRLCDEALAAAPGDATMLVLKSEALRNLDFYEEAVELARQATLSRNGAGFTHKALGLALLDLADEEEEPSLIPAAEEAFRAAQERDPEDGEIRYWLAEAHARQGQGGRAVEELARLGVEVGWLSTTVARLVRLVGDGARPRPPLERTAALRHPDACRSLAIALRAVGEWEAAYAEIAEAMRVDPIGPELDYQAAAIAYSMGEYERALELVAPALWFPSFVEAAELAAVCFHRLGKAQEARRYYRDATERGERYGAPEQYLMHLDRQVKMLEEGGADLAEPTDVLAPPEWAIPYSAAREQRITLGFHSVDEYRRTMARMAATRVAESPQAEFTARYIARTARHYAPPKLAEQAWDRAMGQAGAAWELMDVGERQQLAGLLVVGEWLSGPDGTSPVDAAVLPRAALGLARSAAEARIVDESLHERLNALAAELEGSPSPLSLAHAWDLVAELLGPPGQAGPLQAVLMSPRAEAGA